MVQFECRRHWKTCMSSIFMANPIGPVPLSNVSKLHLAPRRTAEQNLVFSLSWRFWTPHERKNFKQISRNHLFLNRPTNLLLGVHRCAAGGWGNQTRLHWSFLAQLLILFIVNKSWCTFVQSNYSSSRKSSGDIIKSLQIIHQFKHLATVIWVNLVIWTNKIGVQSNWPGHGHEIRKQNFNWAF